MDDTITPGKDLYLYGGDLRHRNNEVVKARMIFLHAGMDVILV